MTKMVTVYLGVLLLAMLFSSQVHANSTMTPMMNVTSTMYSMTTVNGTGNSTGPGGAGVSLQSSVLTLLLVLACSLLHGRL